MLIFIAVFVLATIPRRWLILASAAFMLVGIVGAAPLAYSVWASPYPEGLAISSLSLYPLTPLAIICTLAARGFVAWIKRAPAGS